MFKESQCAAEEFICCGKYIMSKEKSFFYMKMTYQRILDHFTLIKF